VEAVVAAGGLAAAYAGKAAALPSSSALGMSAVRSGGLRPARLKEEPHSLGVGGRRLANGAVASRRSRSPHAPPPTGVSAQQRHRFVLFAGRRLVCYGCFARLLVMAMGTDAYGLRPRCVQIPVFVGLLSHICKGRAERATELKVSIGFGSEILFARPILGRARRDPHPAPRLRPAAREHQDQHRQA